VIFLDSLLNKPSLAQG